MSSGGIVTVMCRLHEPDGSIFTDKFSLRLLLLAVLATRPIRLPRRIRRRLFVFECRASVVTVSHGIDVSRPARRRLIECGKRAHR